MSMPCSTTEMESVRGWCTAILNISEDDWCIPILKRYKRNYSCWKIGCKSINPMTSPECPCQNWINITNAFKIPTLLAGTIHCWVCWTAGFPFSIWKKACGKHIRICHLGFNINTLPICSRCRTGQEKNYRKKSGATQKSETYRKQFLKLQDQLVKLLASCS